MAHKSWQQPYVNLFKHYGAGDWQKCSKEGDVTKIMDRSVKSSIFRVTGAIPSANYIQLPKTKCPPLNLYGNFIYILYKPIVGKYFSIHMDLVTNDDVVVRVSLSNIFKEFKLSSTWLQFPVLAHPAYGSVEEATTNATGLEQLVGAEPISSRWTLLCLDMQYVLSVYLNKQFSHLKSLRLCSSMFVRNVFTSSVNYEPGLNVSIARKTGLLASGVVPLPREMSFPLDKHESWHIKYDYIQFPNTGSKGSQAIIGKTKSPTLHKKTKSHQSERLTTKSKLARNPKSQDDVKERSKSCHKSRIALAEKVASKLSHNNQNHKSMNSSTLPEVGLNSPVTDLSQLMDEKINMGMEQKVVKAASRNRTQDSLHIYAKPKMSHSRGKENNPVNSIGTRGDLKKSKCLDCDPILKLNQIVGFGGGTYRNAFWSDDSNYVMYPCHACIVKYDLTTGQQKFFLGHNEKVSSMCVTNGTDYLVSAQLGKNSVIRIWKVSQLKCLNVFPSNLENICLLSISNNNTMLCAVGQDSTGKQVLSIWNICSAFKGGSVNLVAKAHTELSTNTITSVKFSPRDDTRLVTCGNRNVRIWRVKPKQLRSCPIDLGQFSNVQFTDLAFEVTKALVEDSSDFKIYLTTTCGKVYIVNYKSLKLFDVHPLSDLSVKNADPSHSLNCLSVSENFCAIGCGDGYLRLWPLSFKSVYLEAEHEGAVSLVSISKDSTRILAGTIAGNIGLVDIVNKSYSTITRSHVSTILSLSLNPNHQQVATISSDNTIKLWDLDTFQQVYDFQSATEAPTSVSCHPTLPELACGFDSGAVRIFNLATTSLKYDLKEHLGSVYCTLYNPNSKWMYSAGADGSIVHYETKNSYHILRNATDTVYKMSVLPSYSLAIDDQGHRIATIGPSQFLITVLSASSLDELLHMDITSTIRESGNKSMYIMDEPIGLCFSPTTACSELLVLTSKSRLLKFNSKSGQLLSECTGIHKDIPTSVTCCPNGHYIATSGDECIKVWDYKMDSCQVFIGHSSDVSKMVFTNDCQKIVSVGEMIGVWDFMPFYRKEEETKIKLYPTTLSSEIDQPVNLEVSINPRSVQPTPKSPTAASHIEFDPEKTEENRNSSEDSDSIILDTVMDKNQSDIFDFEIVDSTKLKGPSETISRNEKNLLDVSEVIPSQIIMSHHAPPNVMVHFKAYHKQSVLANRRYAAPLHQAGMQLTAVIGSNGNGRNNIIWHPETGLFVYSQGCHLVLEDLSNGKQDIHYNPIEEISTIALQHGAKVVAVGGAVNPTSKFGPIIIWDLSNGRIEKTLEHHNCNVIGLEYSRDDRFLLSLGNFQECSIVIWSTQDYAVLTQATTEHPMHSARWHPFSTNELVTVGRNKTVYFWSLNDEKPDQAELEVTAGDLPREVFKAQDENKDVTSVSYAGKDLMLTATARGVVCVWLVSEERCFMHWQADTDEIGVLTSGSGKVVTGSTSKNLRLWALPDLEKLLTNNDASRPLSSNGVVMEKEQTLDGAITSMVFDETLEMGVIGTLTGSIWYLNWTDSVTECVRIVSGHQNRINDVVSCIGNDGYLATACADGSLKLWSLETREQSAQFLVLSQECTCVSFCSEYQEKATKHQTKYNQIVHPVKRHQEQPSQCIAGYQDGTLRMFDFGKMKMLLKTKPHSSRVTAVTSSFDGRVAISGSADGLLVITSMTTGMTIRVLNDHKCSQICSITQQQSANPISSSLWLASSADCRISVWRADWSKDICELNDWITFASPGFSPEKNQLKEQQVPCLAVFSPTNSDLFIYSGFGVQKEIAFYSMIKKKVFRKEGRILIDSSLLELKRLSLVIKTISLTNWALSMDISPCGNILVVGCKDRLIKLVDCDSGTFQDFVGHYDSVTHAQFTKDGRELVTSAHSEILNWKVLV